MFIFLAAATLTFFFLRTREVVNSQIPSCAVCNSIDRCYRMCHLTLSWLIARFSSLMETNSSYLESNSGPTDVVVLVQSSNSRANHY